MFPNQLYEVVFEEELSTTSISVRLYGGALLSKSSVLFMHLGALLRYSECNATMYLSVHSLCFNDADTLFKMYSLPLTIMYTAPLHTVLLCDR